jgi:DNA-binding transcriptional LysR family regulator
LTVTVKTGSFSSATRSLNIVQSIVSQHVINLEVDCNTQLFDRSRGYPIHTETGDKLLPHAQAIIEQHKNSALVLADNTTRGIIITLDESISFEVIVGIISKIQDDFPNVTLEFLSVSNLDLIDMLKSETTMMGPVFSRLTMTSYLDLECIGSKNLTYMWLNLIY